MMTMKKIKICTLIGSILLLFSACDKVDMPFRQSGGTVVTTTQKKVLLEDYTGHLCVNCPSAGKIAIDLQQLYKGRLIVIGVHAGYFASVQGVPFDDDFNAEASTDWDNFFGVSAAGNPNGIINRIGNSGVFVVGPGDLSTKVADLIEQEASASVEIATSYNTDTRKLDLAITSTFLSLPEGEVKLQVCLVEDSIIGAQKNNDPTIGPSVIMNYVHRHVLREAVNSSWGTNLLESGVQAAIETPYTNNFTLNLNSNWNDSQCYVVAWLYNAQDYSVIQVEEKKIH